MLGRWEGDGVGEYPTIDDFAYTETITFAPLADKPVIQYTSTTRHADDGRPLHAETGYLRVLGESKLELVVAQAPGLIEAAQASPPTRAVPMIDMRSGWSSIPRSSVARQPPRR